MIGRFVAPHITPFLKSCGDRLFAAGFDSKKIYTGAFLLGLSGCFLAAMAAYLPGLVFLILARVMAGIARQSNTAPSPKFTYLATMMDFFIFAAFVFLFTLSAPGTSMAAAFAIFSILLMGMAYMGAAAYAPGQDRSGVVGEGEMIVFMAACCLFPAGFAAISMIFGFLCCATAGLRVFNAAKSL